MRLSSGHTLILFAGLAYGHVDAVPSSGTETDVPGAAHLLSLSDCEASGSGYHLVGAPSSTVDVVTVSNAGSDAVKSGTIPTSAAFTGSMTATPSTPSSSEVTTLTTKTAATVVSGVSSSAPGMISPSSSGVAGTSSEIATAVTMSTTAGTASGSVAAARTEKTTSTTSASASSNGSRKNAADMVRSFAYGAGVVLLAVVLGGF